MVTYRRVWLRIGVCGYVYACVVTCRRVWLRVGVCVLV